MKKLFLLLYLCAISYNTAWTSGAATSSVAANSSAASSQSLNNAIQAKKICVTILSRPDDIQSTAQDNTCKELLRTDRNRLAYYNECTNSACATEHECNLLATCKPDPEFFQAISYAIEQAKKCNLYTGNHDSVWLIEGASVKKATRTEITKSFPKNPKILKLAQLLAQ